MKQFFVILCVLATGAFSSCRGHNDSMTDGVDSVSCALGTLWGGQFAQMVANFPVDTINMNYIASSFAKSKLKDEAIDNMKQQLGVAIDNEAFMHAFRSKLTGRALMDEAQANAILQVKATAAKAESDRKAKELADKNMAEGKAFLESNAKAEGVVTTESGLQYKVITMGKGPKPTESDAVKANYRGTLIDGTEFDASKGEPIQFSLRGVIKGWTEVLQLMPVGSKWQVFIPSELAYGPRQMGDKIGPNSTLIFEIELVEIVKK